MNTRGPLSLIACDSGKVFASRISKALEKMAVGDNKKSFSGVKASSEVFFPNGEVKTVLNETVRGDDVYIVQCVDDPNSERSVNDNIMALMTAINAAKQSDAEYITVVLPQFPYARQERKKGREGITARQVCRFLEISGANRVISLDIHSEAVCGFFETATLDNIHSTKPMIDFFKSIHNLNNLTVVSPDMGSADRSRKLSRLLACDIAICDKERDYSKPGVVKNVRLVGNVEGRDVLMVDDMIATGGSILEAAASCKKFGAKNIYLGCSLPFFNGDALSRFSKAYSDGLFNFVMGTDAVERTDDFIENNSWYKEVSVAPLFARVIYHINKKQSVSTLLE